MQCGNLGDRSNFSLDFGNHELRQRHPIKEANFISVIRLETPKIH